MLTEGIPLGIVTPAEIGQKSVLLAPGDVVLFYTDGVSDALDAAGEAFGEARLVELVSAHRSEPAEAIADAIREAVRTFAGETMQYDDFSLIVVRRDVQD